MPSAWRGNSPAQVYRPQTAFSGVRDILPQPAGQAPLPQVPVAEATYSGLRYIGQVGKCFLVCEAADAFVLIDQHAAHERVLFEQFVQRARTQGYAAQQLLIPQTIPLIPAEVAALDEAAELLAPLGFVIEAAGERAVRVRAHPAILRDRDVAAEVRALAVSLTQGGRGAATLETLERAAATLACHSAWRAGDTMQPDDVQRLLLEMEGVDLSAYCPHGRPVVFRANWTEVGRWFGRP